MVAPLLPPDPGPAPTPDPNNDPYTSGGSFGGNGTAPPPPGSGTQPPPGSAGSGALPGWLVVGVGLLIVGAVAELLYTISPQAGVGFALLVVLGYAATGGHITEVTKFFQSIGVVAQ